MRALISGVSGQDGWYLSQHLKSLGYRVFGGYRRGSNTILPDGVEPVPMEMTEYESVRKAIKDTKPDEVYNLAAQSHVGESFNCPLYTGSVNHAGVVRILEALRGTRTRLYQASTSEMFGGGRGLSEKSPFLPKSPYAIAKVAAHNACTVYRVAYGVRASTGILFNHESPRRGKDFVTRKVCIAASKNEPVKLGNLEAVRDWGHAKDYVKAMHLMLQHDPDDFVVATGQSYSVQELVNLAYGIACNEVQVEKVESEERPWDVEELEGDPTKAREVLGWEPEYDFYALIKEMVESEIPPSLRRDLPYGAGSKHQGVVGGGRSLF